MPKPIHDNDAVARGGRMTYLYAHDLAKTGVTRDYVARALLARKLDPEVVKATVEEAFRSWKAELTALGTRNFWLGIVLVVLAGGLGGWILTKASSLGQESSLFLFLEVLKLAGVPFAAGIALAVWGRGQLNRAGKI